ncbi:TFIIB-type zinc ribbon-containing protein [Halovenus sp. WSH3]|uniref:TFIIB-type zinc ribbon-containing protein n=1 Tax=Halovenus carboxidivorans TaxID=2692199 RepID=A0A6B0TAY5_9EURY|nr:TFIIB-type zinc ribbon-containing protein [Halovenus carboxidivorans]MXR50339.1 TFIIB-type zinc ribbon-containing protein [Halovenus carboxidivorans]
MNIRGNRKCTACGARWSYYETGDIACPECGSLKSVGTDERQLHTAGTADLDLTGVVADIDTVSTRELADSAGEEVASYIRTVGFIDAGTLQPLSETYVGACELRRVSTTLGRLLEISTDEELYFLSLLRGVADGERPPPSEVPETFRPERGLAATAAVDAYLTDLRRVYDDREQPVDQALSWVSTQKKRIEALDGDVDPTEADRLVRTVQDIGRYLRTEDESALARALDSVDTEIR